MIQKILRHSREGRLVHIALLMAVVQLTLVYLMANGVQIYSSEAFADGAFTMGYWFLILAFVLHTLESFVLSREVQQ